MRNWLQRFMFGRYGQDSLNTFLIVLAVILWIISMFVKVSMLKSLVLALLILSVFRQYSRKITRRQQENAGFLRIKGKVTQRINQSKLQFNQSKTHRFYKCPSCKQKMRVPRGKGKIEISCPKCKTTFERKT